MERFNCSKKNDMDRDGYVRLAATVPSVRVTDVSYNVAAICRSVADCVARGAEVVVTPELCVTGYTCGDLFLQQALLEDAEEGLKKILEASRCWKSLVAVGVPVRHNGALYNCAAMIHNGILLGLVPKSWLPNYGEFYEKRWFVSGKDIIYEPLRFAGFDTYIGVRQLFCSGELRVATELCEDLWVPQPPSTEAALQGANVILNLSATDEVAGKHAYLIELIRQQSARLRCAYVYASAGFGESSSDLVFGGNGLVAEDGRLLSQTERFGNGDKSALADSDLQLLDHDRAYAGCFATAADNTWHRVGFDLPEHKPYKKLLRPIEPHPFVPAPGDDKCLEIANIQTEGLRRRLEKLGGCPSVIGLSGGLDSTLAMLVTVMAYDRQGIDRKNIHAITMPGFGTTSRTYSNACEMAKSLGVTLLEIPIGEAAAAHLKAIGHDGTTTDITYENAQARERTQVLMDYSNRVGGIVIGTGDLSELALGWCTYNGDHMSMYGVNASVPKTLVRHLVEWYGRELGDEKLKRILDDVLATPVSPELIPGKQGDDIAQRTEDLVGPYELHDFFLYQMVRCGFRPRKIHRLAVQAFGDKYPEVIITRWLREFVRRFFNQQFKRNCLPDGPKVGSVCLSPRGDWRMPSDAYAALWQNDLTELIPSYDKI